MKVSVVAPGEPDPGLGRETKDSAVRSVKLGLGGPDQDSTAESNVSSSLEAWWVSPRPYLLSILRIVSAFLFLQFGTAKLFALPGPIMPDGGTAPVGSLPWVAGALEAVGGTVLLLGLFTRPVDRRATARRATGTGLTKGGFHGRPSPQGQICLPDGSQPPGTGGTDYG